MLRESLQALIMECRKIKVAYQVPCYELEDYDDGCIATFRLRKVDSVSKLAILTQGFDVRIYADNGLVILTVYENYNAD